MSDYYFKVTWTENGLHKAMGGFATREAAETYAKRLHARGCQSINIVQTAEPVLTAEKSESIS
jgi:hypothetical protein